MNSPIPSRTPSAELLPQLILAIIQINGQLLADGNRRAKNLEPTSAFRQVLGVVNKTPLTEAQIARSRKA